MTYFDHRRIALSELRLYFVELDLGLLRLFCNACFSSKQQQANIPWFPSIAVGSGGLLLYLMAKDLGRRWLVLPQTILQWPTSLPNDSTTQLNTEQLRGPPVDIQSIASHERKVSISVNCSNFFAKCVKRFCFCFFVFVVCVCSLINNASFPYFLKKKI